jgi:hypothetical protein
MAAPEVLTGRAAETDCPGCRAVLRAREAMMVIIVSGDYRGRFLRDLVEMGPRGRLELERLALDERTDGVVRVAAEDVLRMLAS